MKKSKVLAIFLAIAIMITGAAYASWTDKLNINNTVSTGELNVEFVDATLGNGGIKILPTIRGLETRGDYVKAAINKEDSKTIRVTVGDLYPGTGVLYAVKFENKGTIPAVIDNIEVNFIKDNTLLKNNLIVIGGYIHFDKNGRIKDMATFPGLFGTFAGKFYLKDFQNNLNNALKNERMEPGDYITLDIPENDKSQVANLLTQNGIEGFDPTKDNCVIMGLPSSAGNNLKNQTAEFDIKINFKQHNQ